MSIYIVKQKIRRHLKINKKKATGKKQKRSSSLFTKSQNVNLSSVKKHHMFKTFILLFNYYFIAVFAVLK